MTTSKCVGCAGKGYIWGRTRTNEKGHMTKRKCGYCKGTGEVAPKVARGCAKQSGCNTRVACVQMKRCLSREAFDNGA